MLHRTELLAQLVDEGRLEPVPGAETLAVAWPPCTVMLGDGVRAVGSGQQVADVATLLAENLDA